MVTLLEQLIELLLNRWDPIGVACIPEAADEYDTYALDLHIALTGGAEREAIAQYLNWVVTGRMGLTCNLARDREIADLALAIYADYG